MNKAIETQIKSNINRSYIIIFFFVLFVLMVSFLFSRMMNFGGSFVWIVLFMSLASVLGSYYYGDKMILSLSKAHEADKSKEEKYYQTLGKIAYKAKLPLPKFFIVEEIAQNAFATGRDPQHASICITRGLLNSLSTDELEAVMAHELSHIKNYDIRLMVLVSLLVGIISILADWFMRSLWWRGQERENRNSAGLMLIIGLLLAMLSPVIATIIQLAVSRRREYLADASGALMIQKPKALATALEKISHDTHSLSTATNATAHLYIANPFKGKKAANWLSVLFNTHPPVEERIKILNSL